MRGELSRSSPGSVVVMRDRERGARPLTWVLRKGASQLRNHFPSLSSSSHFSPKKPARTTLPGKREFGGVVMSITA